MTALFLRRAITMMAHPMQSSRKGCDGVVIGCSKKCDGVVFAPWARIVSAKGGRRYISPLRLLAVFVTGFLDGVPFQKSRDPLFLMAVFLRSP